MSSDREQLSTRIDRELMDLVRGVCAAEMRRGKTATTLQWVVEDALRRHVARARRRGLELVPVPRGAGRRVGN